MAMTSMRTAASGVVVLAAFAVVGMMAFTQPSGEGDKAEKVGRLAGSVAGMVETGHAAPEALAKSEAAAKSAMPQAPAASATPAAPAPQSANAMPVQPRGQIVWIPVIIANPVYYRPVMVAPTASAYAAGSYPGHTYSVYRTTPYQAGRVAQPSFGFYGTKWVCPFIGWWSCDAW